MPFLLVCPECSARLKSPTPVPAGRTIPCPQCKTKFTTREPATAIAPAGPAKPSPVKPAPAKKAPVPADDVPDIVDDAELSDDDIVDDTELDEPATPAAKKKGPPPAPGKSGKKKAVEDDDEEEEDTELDDAPRSKKKKAARDDDEDEEDRPRKSKKKPKKKEKSPALLIGIIAGAAVLLIGGGIGAYFAFSGPKKTTEVATAPDAPKPAPKPPEDPFFTEIMPLLPADTNAIGQYDARVLAEKLARNWDKEPGTQDLARRGVRPADVETLYQVTPIPPPSMVLDPNETIVLRLRAAPNRATLLKDSEARESNGKQYHVAPAGCIHIAGERLVVFTHGEERMHKVLGKAPADELQPDLKDLARRRTGSAWTAATGPAAAKLPNMLVITGTRAVAGAPTHRSTSVSMTFEAGAIQLSQELVFNDAGAANATKSQADATIAQTVAALNAASGKGKLPPGIAEAKAAIESLKMTVNGSSLTLSFRVTGEMAREIDQVIFH